MAPPIRDWSQLPPDLLLFISSKTTDITDLVRFRAVCKPWRSAITLTNHPHILPFLLLPYYPHTNYRRFLNLSSKKIHTLHLPKSRCRVIYGTAHGWLIMVDYKSFSISLLNPLTRTLIHLPQITSFPVKHGPALFLLGDVVIYHDWLRPPARTMTLDILRSFFRFHVFMFGDEFSAAVTTTSPPEFLYCKVGDSAAWTMLRAPTPVGITAITFLGGRFYAICHNDVVVWDINKEAVEGTTIPSPGEANQSYWGIVAFAGDLLLVGSYFESPDEDGDEDDEDGDKYPGKVSFYKLDESGQLKWSRLEGIGDRILFIAAREEDLLMAVNASGCRRNSIFKFDPCNRYSTEVCPFHHINVFNIGDYRRTDYRTKKPLGSCNIIPADFPGPLWFTPTLC